MACSSTTPRGKAGGDAEATGVGQDAAGATQQPDEGQPAASDADQPGECEGEPPFEDACMSCECADGEWACTAAEVGAGCESDDCCMSAATCQPCTGADCPASGLTCLGPPSVTCEGGTECTQGQAACVDESCSCSYVAIADGAPCVADVNACTQGDSCVAGECVSGGPAETDDGNPCTSGVCIKGVVEQKFLTGPCSDGDPCTKGDFCTLGQCVPEALKDCPANPCAESAWCDPAVGECVYELKKDGAACETMLGCGQGECLSGQCTGSTAECDDENPCTIDSCGAEGECTNQPISGPECGSGDACMGASTCKAGACAPGVEVECLDGDECTLDVCNPESGCSFKAIAGCGEPVDGKPCASWAAEFDGSSCIEVPGVMTEPTTAYTIEFWIRTENSASPQFVVEKVKDKDYMLPGWRIRYAGLAKYSESLHYEQVKNTGNFHGALTPEGSVKPGTWVHYALVRYDNTIIDRFVNGVSTGKGSFSAKWLSDQSNDSPLWIGCQDFDDGFFKGRIDELRISNMVRYPSNFEPPTEPLQPDASTLLLYHFEEAKGTQVLDSGPAAKHGTWKGQGAWSKTSPVLVSECGGDTLPLGTTVYDTGEQVVTGTVPAGVTSIHFEVWGAGGGGGWPSTGGAGGWVAGDVSVAPGDPIELRVASGGVSPGGGGGASYVLHNGVPVIVAAGGGGAGADGCHGCDENFPDGAGGGGGPAGGVGQKGWDNNKLDTGSGGGHGGTQSQGGAGGDTYNTSNYSGCETDGLPGAKNEGGAAIKAQCKPVDAAIGEKGGKTAVSNGGCGGGGAGYYGGGSGACKYTYSGGGGGGGSSFAAATVQNLTTGGGNGVDTGGKASASWAPPAGQGGKAGVNNWPDPNIEPSPGVDGRIVIHL